MLFGAMSKLWLSLICLFLSDYIVLSVSPIVSCLATQKEKVENELKEKEGDAQQGDAPEGQRDDPTKNVEPSEGDKLLEELEKAKTMLRSYFTNDFYGNWTITNHTETPKLSSGFEKSKGTAFVRLSTFAHYLT